MKEKYSEDYSKLLAYCQNPCKEEAEELARFFEEKYQKLIEHYCKLYVKFGKTTSLRHSYTRQIDFNERSGFTRDFSFVAMERKTFLREIFPYIVRAVENFKPDQIKTKESYTFAQYLKLWLKTGLRDIRRHNKKYLIKEIPIINNPEAEDEIIARLDNEILDKKLSKVMSQLSAVDRKICSELSEGKQQNEIDIINEKTGSLYSTSYICKRIKAIRSVMESYGLAP